MLNALRSETETRLSTSIATVGIAYPNGAALSVEETNDALVYTGFKKLHEWPAANKELNAAYGAYGFGLCPSYADPYDCEEEEEAFGEGDVVLHVDYTTKTLAVNTTWIATARHMRRVYLLIRH